MSSNQVTIEKVPFDVLEVGCRYESRCGEVWEVVAETECSSLYKFEAKNLSGRESSLSFVSNGAWIWEDIPAENDLTFKLVEINPSRVEEQSKHEMEDKGKHYRHSFKLRLSESDIANGYVTVNLDPYRISDVYELGGWREHVVKKALRGTLKGHSEQELIDELRACIDRAEQMMKEDWKENE